MNGKFLHSYLKTHIILMTFVSQALLTPIQGLAADPVDMIDQKCATGIRDNKGRCLSSTIPSVSNPTNSDVLAEPKPYLAIQKVYPNPNCPSKKSDFNGRCLAEITPYQNKKCASGISNREGVCLQTNDPLIAGNRANMLAPPGSVSSGIDPVEKAKKIKTYCASSGKGVYESETGVLYKSCEDYMNEKYDRYETAKVDAFNKLQDDRWNHAELERKSALQDKVNSINEASKKQARDATIKVAIGVAVTVGLGILAYQACTAAAPPPAGNPPPAESLIHDFTTPSVDGIYNIQFHFLKAIFGEDVYAFPGDPMCWFYTGAAILSAVATRNAYMSSRKSVTSSEELSVLASPTASLPKMVKSSEMIDPNNPLGEMLNESGTSNETKAQIANFNNIIKNMNNKGMQIDFMNGNFTAQGKTYNADQLSRAAQFQSINAVVAKMKTSYTPAATQAVDRAFASRSNNDSWSNSTTATAAVNARGTASTTASATSSAYRSAAAVRAPSSFSGAEYFPTSQIQTVQYKNGELIHADPGPTSDGKPALFSVSKPVWPIIERATGFVNSAN